MSQRVPKKDNVKNNKTPKPTVDPTEERRRVAELTSIIRVTNFTGTIRAWKVSTVQEKPKPGPSKPKKAPMQPGLTSAGCKGKQAANTTKKKEVPVCRVKPSILRRELRKKQQQSRLSKVLELNRKFLLDPILHIHLVVNGTNTQNEQVEVAPVRPESWSYDRRERELDPTLPILPDQNENPCEMLEECGPGIDAEEWDSNWDVNGEWVLEPNCSICGQKNHVDLPSIVSVNQFHPDETCIICGLFHENQDPCNMDIPVEPVIGEEILL